MIPVAPLGPAVRRQHAKVADYGCAKSARTLRERSLPVSWATLTRGGSALRSPARPPITGFFRAKRGHTGGSGPAAQPRTEWRGWALKNCSPLWRGGIGSSAAKNIRLLTLNAAPCRSGRDRQAGLQRHRAAIGNVIGAHIGGTRRRLGARRGRRPNTQERHGERRIRMHAVPPHDPGRRRALAVAFGGGRGWAEHKLAVT
jgi:hypothetical protein